MTYEYEPINTPHNLKHNTKNNDSEKEKQNNDSEDDPTMHVTNKRCYGSLYSITHIIISFFAIYLSWKCNNEEFNLPSFIMAIICPHFYIIYSLAVNGGCGIFETTPPPQPEIQFPFRFKF